ncbi:MULTISPECIES: hypothetical protein [Vibrio]|uniref:Uncharacterized protein n=1 Tax=Vibrio tasmaniensis TaxID=212663 RepID=A0A2N7NCQ1_9VIBR|nr:hypothetical protein [Vibrio tasmaniensis]PMO89869.1 hypothetical protein BCT01_00890 [Vibrio tasmaniensis]PMP09959.1 hypothetical protein BCS92_02200 [Vibrio tasmaniensis]TKG27974.1 hypothetical protein FC057_22565 [Vibrio tasmaniensis]TKG40541.1 hypothetical protein FC060_23820 [Vibrio tasmaniensis]TKG41661.1 hypothetical protein FC063_07305 [Vibrio tasmaniensis]
MRKMECKVKKDSEAITFSSYIDYSTTFNSWATPSSLNNSTSIIEPAPVNTKYIAVGALAAAAFTYSPKANAGLDDIINQLTSQFEEMFEPLLSSVLGGFGKILNAGQSDGSSAIVKAISTSGDMQIKALTEAANNRLTMASMPPPNHCESDDIGMASKNSNQSSNLTLRELSKTSVKNYEPNSIPFSVRISGIANRYSNNEHITMSTALSSTKLDSSQVKMMIDGIDVLTAKQTDSISLDPAMANSESNVSRTEYLLQSAKAAKLEVSKGAFYDAVADRTVASHGESKLSLIEKEVDRTYGGGSSWRDDLLNFGDPTPLLAELNKQVSLSNYILSESLKKTSQQNILIATNNVDTI